jgi:hypothetical protein
MLTALQIRARGLGKCGERLLSQYGQSPEAHSECLQRDPLFRSSTPLLGVVAGTRMRLSIRGVPAPSGRALRLHWQLAVHALASLHRSRVDSGAILPHLHVHVLIVCGGTIYAAAAYLRFGLLFLWSNATEEKKSQRGGNEVSLSDVRQLPFPSNIGPQILQSMKTVQGNPSRASSVSAPEDNEGTF